MANIPNDIPPDDGGKKPEKLERRKGQRRLEPRDPAKVAEERRKRLAAQGQSQLPLASESTPENGPAQQEVSSKEEGAGAADEQKLDPVLKPEPETQKEATPAAAPAEQTKEEPERFWPPCPFCESTTKTSVCKMCRWRTNPEMVGPYEKNPKALKEKVEEPKTSIEKTADISPPPTEKASEELPLKPEKEDDRFYCKHCEEYGGNTACGYCSHHTRYR